MITLTPKALEKYLRDYDYEVTTEQARSILELLDSYYEIFASVDIQEVADYILKGSNSKYAYYFE
ncbi:DUF2624 domain-containing protein [Clostridium sp. CX1]|uniref:DUF2624 domain-containing protein n=1 Tax=Clostridium sp. CX1 TaxID=2978346 RepID=UPI0021BFBB19|nr:DUF2624 domain-containing protein [Clostridium sp. CX1]MCT8976279.1 DUF2624 domain-containing protein [Clostridium sp. CX1]